MKGIAGIGNTPRRRIDHDHAAHAHGNVLIQDPPVQPVGNGLQTVLAGHDLLVGLNEIFGTDVELRTILTCKGSPRQILPQGAAAHGNLDSCAGFGFQLAVGTLDDFFKVRGHRRPNDQLLDVGAQREQLIQLIHLRGLQDAVNLGLQLVMFKKPLVGQRGYHETRRDRQIEAGHHLSQIGHFAPDLIGHGHVDRFEGKHQPFPLRQPSPGKHFVDSPLNLLEPVKELLVFAGSELVQVLDNAENIDRNRSTVRSNKRHPKRPGAPQRFLHFRHDFQSLVIGSEEYLKAVIAVFKGSTKLFDSCRRELLSAASEGEFLEKVCQDPHDASQPCLAPETSSTACLMRSACRTFFW